MPIDEFINIPFTYETLDKYHIRNSIFEALRSNIHIFSGELLDIGCGKMPYKQYLLLNSNISQYTGLDIENAFVYDTIIKPDITWDGNKIPLSDETIDTAMATEVLEHCPDTSLVINEIHRVLKKDSYLFFTVPFLWNLHEVPHDEYRFTPFSLKRILIKAGFSNISIHSTGGWHASLAQMLGLWVRRSPLSQRKKKYFSIVLKPIIKYLIKKDRLYPVSFKEGQMITGLYGVCKK